MQEAEEKRREDGFFTKVYKAVCHAMGDENINKLEELNGDMAEMIKFTYELQCFKDALTIKVCTFVSSSIYFMSNFRSFILRRSPSSPKPKRTMETRPTKLART